MSVHRKFKASAVRDAQPSVTYIDAVPLSVSIAPRRTWRERIMAWLANARARRELLRCHDIDPRLARDIGLSQSDLLRESYAPFWEEVRRR